MTSLLQRVLAHSRAYPSAPAQIVKRRGRWQSVCWVECLVQIARATSALAAAGLAPGDRVAVIGDCEPEIVWTTLALLAVGAVVVPLDPGATSSQVAAAMQISRASHAAIGDLEQFDKLRNLPLARVFSWRATRSFDTSGHTLSLLEYLPLGSISERSASVPSATVLDVAGDLDAPAIVVLGSDMRTLRTRTQRHLIGAAQALLKSLAIDHGDRYLCSVPLAYEVGAVVGLALPLLLPLTACFQESPDQVEPALRELQPELAMMDEPYWERVANDLARRVRRSVITRIGAETATGARLTLRRGCREMLLNRPLRRHLGLANAKAVLSIGSGRGCPELESYGIALVGVDARGALLSSNGATPLSLTTS